MEYTVERKTRYQLTYQINGVEKTHEFKALNPDAAINFADMLLRQKLKDAEPRIYLCRWAYLNSWIKMGFWIDIATWTRE